MYKNGVEEVLDKREKQKKGKNKDKNGRKREENR
jgi:hypothetical protein